MKLKEDFLIRSIAGEYVVVPVGDNSTKCDGIVVLNEVSYFILSNMKNHISRDELLELLLAKYDVNPEEAKEDLNQVIETLDSYGMIEFN